MRTQVIVYTSQGVNRALEKCRRVQKEEECTYGQRACSQETAALEEAGRRIFRAARKGQCSVRLTLRELESLKEYAV